MARPSAKKKQGAGRRKGEETVEVLDALAARLAGLGRRKWKTKELAAALEKAAGSVEDEAVRAHIRDNLQQCAQQLHDKLQAPADEPPAQAAKRPKRGKKAAAPEAVAAVAADPEAAAVLPPTLASAEGYRQLAAAAAEGRPDARFTTASLLLARKLPAERLVAAHVRQLVPGAGEPADADASPQQQQQRAEALVVAAATALGVCAALSAEAAGPEDALRMFAPAVSHLCDASQLLTEQPDAAAAAALPLKLAQLAARTLASMHAVLRQQRLALGTSQGDAAPCFWRSNPQQQHADGAAGGAEAACSASASICALCTTLRLHGPSGQAAPGRLRQQVEALAVAAAADLRLLAPYAASGQLAYLASLPLDEARGSDGAARRFLALYGGAARQEIVGEQDYLARLAAARKASAVAEHLGEGALAACILEEAARLPVSRDFQGWLHEQPPSGIVSAALAASRRGLDALSAHLAHECSQRGLQALLAAMQRSSLAGGGGGEASGAAAEGEAAAAQDGALDDLLFFADKEGDATVFGRDWHVGSGSEDDEEGDEEGGSGMRGLLLGDLPGGDRRLSDELGSD